SVPGDRRPPFATTGRRSLRARSSSRVTRAMRGWTTRRGAWPSTMCMSLTRTCRWTRSPEPRSAGKRLDDPRGRRAPQLTGHPDAGLDESVEVRTVLDAEPVEGPDEVLRGEVAGGRLRIRAAAHSTRTGVDDRHPARQRRHGVGERLTVGVVEVDADLVHADPGGVQGIQQAAHVTGRADTDRVADGQLVAPQVHQAGADVDNLRDRDGPLPGVPEAHGDVATHPGT